MTKKTTKTTKSTPKVCVITMTHNRPEYIKRSFESLYKRAGVKFDHYVFDDASDAKTLKVLNTLAKKYKFELTVNQEKLGIYKNFYTNITNVPDKYDYYVKMDSDIEFLSDNIFKTLTEVLNKSELSGASPRVEGIFNSDRVYKEHPRVEFYNGHAILPNISLVYGCCMMFPKHVFATFEKLTQKELRETTEKWGIDAMLYKNALIHGHFTLVEDISAYHIDNTYGQRVKDMEYFTQRGRWNIIDNDEVWFLKASKELYPDRLSRDIFEMIRREHSDCKYDEFILECKKVIDKGLANVELKDIEEIKIAPEKQQSKVQKNTIEILEDNQELEVYKITSPKNFIKTEHMEHGSIVYFKKLPTWVKNNHAIVIEKTILKGDEIKNTKVEDVEITSQINTPVDVIIENTQQIFSKATQVLSSTQKDKNLVEREAKDTTKNIQKRKNVRSFRKKVTNKVSNKKQQ